MWCLEVVPVVYARETLKMAEIQFRDLMIKTHSLTVFCLNNDFHISISQSTIKLVVCKLIYLKFPKT